MTQLPASVLAAAPHPAMSSRYVHVSTNEVIHLMQQEGFQLASASSSRSRKAENPFGRHMVDFRLPGAPEIGGAVPRVLFINSHDGSSAAKALSGMFRFACSNGLIVGTTHEQVAVRHSGDAARDLIDRMRLLAKNTEPLFRSVEAWSKKDLSMGQRDAYAKLVAQLRWGDAAMFEPEELLSVRRAEDDKGDLWSVFNRVQENTTRGGLVGLSRSGRRAMSRPLTDIQRDITFNANLWRLTQDVAEAW